MIKPINGDRYRNRNQSPQQQIQQIEVNVDGQDPEKCSCGCVYFQPAVMIYRVSALVSPTGQELTAQRPVLLCMNCNEPWEPKKNEHVTG